MSIIFCRNRLIERKKCDINKRSIEIKGVAMEENLKQKIMEDIKDDYYRKNYSNDGQRFIAWYLRNIHNLDIVEAKECITDGAGDKQIDAVYIDNQDSIVYIIQGKFYSEQTVDAEPLREVLSSWIQIKNLPALQEAANDKLKVKINAIEEALSDDYSVCFELITTASLTEAAEKDFLTFQKELNDNEDLSASIYLVDKETLQFKYEEALNKNRPYINYDFHIDKDKYMELDLDGTKAVIAAIPLKECVKIPGIYNGSLFRKNVRQSLGNSNKVNKEIAKTLKNNIQDFFLLHNGITAICSKITLENGVLSIRELNVVNGCQSLSTIYSYSENVKRDGTSGYIMFRFYEISDAEKADKISISTNSQSTVKARDLRSNDKAVRFMKRAYEQKYTDGYFITKRGEKVESPKYNAEHIINLTDLGKQLIAWHSQRPTISYSETKIFDTYFNQLFHKDYAPENMQALNEIYKLIIKKWNIENPMELNSTLLGMKSYALYHHLYSISVYFCEINKMPESVPNPAKALEKLKENNLCDTIIDMAGNSLNMAFESASAEAGENGKIFNPQNWIKAKASLKNIREAIRNQIGTLRYVTGGDEISKKMNEGLRLDPTDFENRWTAD